MYEKQNEGKGWRNDKSYKTTGGGRLLTITLENKIQNLVKVKDEPVLVLGNFPFTIIGHRKIFTHGTCTETFIVLWFIMGKNGNHPKAF